MGAKAHSEVAGVVVGEGRGRKGVRGADYHTVVCKGSGFTPSHVSFYVVQLPWFSMGCLFSASALFSLKEM